MMHRTLYAAALAVAVLGVVAAAPVLAAGLGVAAWWRRSRQLPA